MSTSKEDSSSTKRVHLSESNFDKIDCSDLNQIQAHEAEIVRRINSVVDGGHLFIVNPLQFLQDLAVKLTPEAREALVAEIPEIDSGSQEAYEALRSNERPQSIRMNLRALLPREQS